MIDNIHRLLKRQCQKHLPNSDNLPRDYESLMLAINDTYWHTEDERKMLERSLELSSQELIQRNSEIQAIFKALPDIFLRISRDGLILAPPRHSAVHFHEGLQWPFSVR